MARLPAEKCEKTLSLFSHLKKWLAGLLIVGRGLQVPAFPEKSAPWQHPRPNLRAQVPLLRLKAREGPQLPHNSRFPLHTRGTRTRTQSRATDPAPLHRLCAVTPDTRCKSHRSLRLPAVEGQAHGNINDIIQIHYKCTYQHFL